MFHNQILAGCFGRIEWHFPGHPFRALDVKEVGAPGHFSRQTTPIEHFDKFFQSSLIFAPYSPGNTIIIQSGNRCFLNRNKLSRIGVVLDICKGIDNTLISTDPAHSPSNHIETFG